MASSRPVTIVTTSRTGFAYLFLHFKDIFMCIDYLLVTAQVNETLILCSVCILYFHPM